MSYSAARKLQCAQHELQMRHRVYPRRIHEGRMTQEQMNEEIAVMQAIVDDYRKLAMLEAAEREPTFDFEKTP